LMWWCQINIFFLNPLDHYAAAIAAPQLILH
jgi:hypothetical protein